MSNGQRFLKAVKFTDFQHDKEALIYCAKNINNGITNPIQGGHEGYEKAVNVYNSVRDKLIANFIGPVKLNRHGQYHGGYHPAQEPII